MKRTACPKCGCTARHKEGFSEGKQRYQCKSCGCKYIGETLDRVYPKCTYCGSNSVYKAGTSRSGSQSYECKSCGKVFIPEPKKKYALSKKEKNNILNWYYNGGFGVVFIARYFGLHRNTVARCIKNHNKS